MSRESRTVIISHGSHTIRAGFGIHEPLKQPSVTLIARVGLRRSHLDKLKAASQSQSKSQTQAEPEEPAVEDEAAETTEPPPHTYIVHPSDYLVGHFLEDAIKHPDNYRDDPVQVFWPMVGGVVRDWAGMQALWYYLLFFSLPVVRSSNASVTLLSLPPQAITRKTSAQIHKIFFEELNVPSFCLVDSTLTSAFAVGQTNACVVDVGWRGSSVACVMDSLLVNSSIRSCSVGLEECIAYLASLLERDMGVAAAIKDIESSEEAAVIEHSPQTSPRQALLLALAEDIFAQGLVTIDAGDAILDAENGGKSNVDDEGNFDVLGALTSGREKEAIAEQEKRNRALVEQGKEPQRVATTASDLPPGETISVTFKETPIPIPSNLLTIAATPLLDPSVLSNVNSAFFALPNADLTPTEWRSTPSLPSTIATSISTIPDLEKRNQLWELLVLTGHATSLIPHLPTSLVSSLSTYVVGGGNISTSLISLGGNNNTTTNPDDPVAFAGAQPANVRALKTPDYFAEFKERTDLAPFLGATIYAKLVFADSQARGYTTKSGYIQSGPGVAFAVTGA